MSYLLVMHALAAPSLLLLPLPPCSDQDSCVSSTGSRLPFFFFCEFSSCDSSDFFFLHSIAKGSWNTLSASSPDEALNAHEPLPAVDGGGADRPPLAQKVTSAPCSGANGSARVWRAWSSRGCYHTRTQCRTIAYSVDVITRPHAR